ncbi:MAG: fatty acid oxidation complex subunit alpha FadJ, partial [Candidatus Marinimicrobia bacterium]|nr:fatty acid oxidation complex subunit alpha FadJ [Candidatus Neomarinimicrobiota bacterium]
GITLLPRLVGLQAALDMLLTGRKVYPYKARKIGLVSEIVSPGVLQQAAAKLVRALADGSYSGRKLKKALVTRLLDGPLKFIVYRAVKKRVAGQTKGNYPAPFKIIETIRKSLGKKIDRALKNEALAFGELMVSPEHKALTHVFFVSSSKPRLEATPAEIGQVAVIGAGLMGAGIATVSLDKGLTVRHRDLDLAALGRARAHLQSYFDKKVKRRILSKRAGGLALNRYSSTIDYSGFGRSQIVVEAVFEDLELKRSIISDLEDQVSPETVIATNTSSLPITEVAAGARHPERIIGMHFFSPVEKMPLVEVIPGRQTSPETVATTVAFGQSLGKRILLVKDSPGFYVNRILTPYLNETFKLLEDGIAADVLDRYARRMGFPVGPCTLIDEVGFDVAAKVSDVMAAFIGNRLEMTDHNTRFLNDDRLGRKNGR